MIDPDQAPEPLREQFEHIAREMHYMVLLATMSGWREGVENCATVVDTTARAFREQMTAVDPASAPYTAAHASAQAMENLAAALRLRSHEAADPVRPDEVSS